MDIFNFRLDYRKRNDHVKGIHLPEGLFRFSISYQIEGLIEVKVVEIGSCDRNITIDNEKFRLPDLSRTLIKVTENATWGTNALVNDITFLGYTPFVFDGHNCIKQDFIPASVLS